VERTCYFHAGCPDGFGAAWSVWKAWGDGARYVPRGHESDPPRRPHVGGTVVFVDIAPDNQYLRQLAEDAAHVVVLDHHLTARERYQADPGVENVMEDGGHRVVFDLAHSGAVLAWRHFHPGAPTPPLLAYVQDQDLWQWALPRSEEVNAAIGAHERVFAVWDALAARTPDELAREGEPILRAQRAELLRVLQNVHPVMVANHRVEAVNAQQNRSHLGHELAKRAAFGHPIGLVYRVTGRQVDASIYSIGEVDVSAIARRYGGGGHRNASGFSVPLRRWLDEFC
jgi:oligoribonuclease NrnB/cAMP/cGMP phosphodiesterase (DHH superfamily)